MRFAREISAAYKTGAVVASACLLTPSLYYIDQPYVAAVVGTASQFLVIRAVYRNMLGGRR